MSWGALNNAGSAMQAMTYGLGTISQNIANMNTTGYKGVTTHFQTQLSEHIGTPTDGTGSSGTSGTNIFGVGYYDRNSISTQGTLQATTNTNDIAINGKGFFMVGTPASTGAPRGSADTKSDNAVYYTRSGSFQQAIDPTTLSAATPSGDGKQYFVNGSGDYLLGWMADSKGVIAQGATLKPVYSMPTTPMTAVPTSNAVVRGNIPSTDTPTQDPQFSTVPLTDPTGNSQSLSLAWTRIDATTWTVAATSVTGGTLGANTNSYTVTTDTSGAITSPAPATVPFSVTWSNGTPVSPSVNLTPLRPTYSTENIPLGVWDTKSNTHTLDMKFEKTATNTWNLYFDTPEASQPQSTIVPMTDAANTAVNMTLTWKPLGGNTYTVTPTAITGGDSASGSATVTLNNGAISAINGFPVSLANPTSQGFFTLTTGSGNTNSPAVDLATGIPTFASVSSPPVSVTFNGLGAITSLGGASGGTYTTTADINWSNGETSAISIDLSGLSQLAGTKAQISSTTQDGYPTGMLESTAFEANGDYVGQFSNGKSLTLFQVPVANFVAENSLAAINGTLFARTQAAGAVSITSIDRVGLAPGQTANLSSSSTIVGGSLESSNVDMGTQFSNMILVQKAYSTNSEVFKTANEMTSTARDLIT
jgi:flagellar hook protein FlgE